MINNNWVFGNNAGLDFSTGTPTPTTGNAISTNEGCASISDSSGNLVIYTDGRTIWDKTHVVRASGLFGNSSSTQSAIIVPDPNNNDQYYVFTADGSSGTNNHFNGGLINVVSWVFTPLSSLMTIPSTTGYSPVEKITAIQHENCKDFWVITILQEGAINAPTGIGTIRMFLVDATGIQHVSDTVMSKTIIDYGYMKASPDGLKLAIANYGDNEILIYPFNKSTGAINLGGLLSINALTTANYGLEFSPNSTILYYSDIFSGPIYQVDLTGTLTSTVVGNITSYTGALQLGPDNRIYIAKSLQNSLGAILDPNILGVGCNVNDVYITLLAGSLSRFGLPNLISNFCTDECDCGCTGCNKDAEAQNEELIDRAKLKYNTLPSRTNCGAPFSGDCKKNAIDPKINLEPCFYLHWGDGVNDQIEEHDTEVFYITVCNDFNDILFKGLKITQVTLNPNLPISSVHIVPDRFINIDCLEPCSCQTRAFAIITRDTNIAGNYTIDVEYCYDEIIILPGRGQGTASFPITITED